MNREYRVSDVELCHEAALAMAPHMEKYYGAKQAAAEEASRIQKGCDGAADLADGYKKVAERHYQRAQEVSDLILYRGMFGSDELPKAM